FETINGVKLTLSPDAYGGERLQLLHNEGGHSFRDITREAGMSGTRGRCLAMQACDYDNDGFDDLYVANDLMPGNLYHNEGLGSGHVHFRDVGVETGTSVS